MLCGTEPIPEKFRAKKYRLDNHFFTKKDFTHVMLNLPVEVSEDDIEEMFTYADQDRDGRISYSEFQTMINPPKPPEPPKPTMEDLTVARTKLLDQPQPLSVSRTFQAAACSPPHPQASSMLASLPTALTALAASLV